MNVEKRKASPKKEAIKIIITTATAIQASLLKVPIMNSTQVFKGETGTNNSKIRHIPNKNST